MTLQFKEPRIRDILLQHHSGSFSGAIITGVPHLVQTLVVEIEKSEAESIKRHADLGRKQLT